MSPAAIIIFLCLFLDLLLSLALARTAGSYRNDEQDYQEQAEYMRQWCAEHPDKKRK